jgi:nitroreductase
MSKYLFHRIDFAKYSRSEMIKRSKKYLKQIQQRRTVREFSKEQVPLDVLKNCLLAAGSAPSGANRQPWHFVIVSDPDIKKRIRISAEKEEKEFYSHRAPIAWLKDLEPLGTDENKPFLEIAPHLIVIFQKKYTVKESGKKHINYYAPESVGIATGILISALHFSGVATLTHTPSPMKFLNKILDRPASEKPYLILVTGYPSKNAVIPDIKKYTLDKITTFVDNYRD